MDNEQLIERMHAIIPQLDDPYFRHKVVGVDVFDVLDKAQKHQVNVKFEGPTGSGKTTHFEAFCEHTKQPHFVANMKGSTTTEELIGTFYPNEDDSKSATYVWKDGVIVRALKYSNCWVEVDATFEDGEMKWEKEYPNYELDVLPNGKVVPEDIIEHKGKNYKVKAWPRCMLTVEEINFSPEELMSVWFSLLDDRRNIVLNEKDGTVIKAGKFLTVNAAMNPDYIGTNKMNEALEDRFTIKLTFDYSVRVENKIINSIVKKFGIHIDKVKAFKMFVKNIRKAYANETCTKNISTRTIKAYFNMLGVFGEKISIESIFNSFDPEDIGFMKEQWSVANSSIEQFDISDEEMEGLDIENFQGWEPPEQKAKAKGKDVKIPF